MVDADLARPMVVACTVTEVGTPTLPVASPVTIVAVWLSAVASPDTLVLRAALSSVVGTPNISASLPSSTWTSCASRSPEGEPEQLTGITDVVPTPVSPATGSGAVASYAAANDGSDGSDSGTSGAVLAVTVNWRWMFAGSFSKS